MLNLPVGQNPEAGEWSVILESERPRERRQRPLSARQSWPILLMEADPSSALHHGAVAHAEGERPRAVTFCVKRNPILRARSSDAALEVNPNAAATLLVLSWMEATAGLRADARAHAMLAIRSSPRDVLVAASFLMPTSAERIPVPPAWSW